MLPPADICYPVESGCTANLGLPRIAPDGVDRSGSSVEAQHLDGNGRLAALDHGGHIVPPGTWSAHPKKLRCYDRPQQCQPLKSSPIERPSSRNPNIGKPGKPTFRKLSADP